MEMNFKRFAVRTAEVVGSPLAFLLSVALIIGWAFAGPRFGWSEGHQLFINTITTIVTFLVVFLIQHTQNRDTKSMHLKIDELLKATRGARNSMIDLDRLSDEQLRKLESEFKRLCDDDVAKEATAELAEAAGDELERRGRKQHSRRGGSRPRTGHNGRVRPSGP